MRGFILFVLFIGSAVNASEEQLQQVESFSITHASGGGSAIVTIATNAEKFVLQLQPAVFGNDTEWVKNSDRTLQFYEGHIEEQPQSWARLTLNGERVYGMVKYQDRYITLSNYDEPLTSFTGPNLRRSLVDRSTLTTSSPANSSQANSSLAKAEGLDTNGERFTRVLKIGVVVDHYYDNQYGGEGVAHALSVVNATDGILRENLELALKVEAVVQTLDEDFSNAEGASTEQLLRFRTFRQSVPELSADLGLVHLFSHAPRNGSVIGRAYLSTVCYTSGFDIGVSLGYSLSSQLMAHELGHNLGSAHDTLNGCEDGPRRIMYPYINDSREFSSCSLDSMSALMRQRECFLTVVDLAVNALLVERTVVVQVSNLNISDQVSDVSLVLDRTDNLINGIPSNCSIDNKQIICSIPTLAAGETVDMQFPVSGNPTGIVNASISVSNSFESDQSDNTSTLDLTDLPDAAPEGLCIDTDGDGFGWNGEKSCRTQVMPLNGDEQKPGFINVQTGIPVNLVQAFWRPAEYIGQVIECVPHYWSSDDRFYKADSSIIRRFRHELEEGQDSRGSVQVATYFTVSEEGDTPGTIVEYFDWNIDSGRYFGPAPVERSSYVQIVDEAGTRFNATRSWTSNISFDLCRSFPEPTGYFVPSGTIDVPIAGVCIDSPPRNDGFGWNGVETCRVDPDLDVTGSRSVIVNSLIEPIQIDGYLDEPAWQSATVADSGGNELKTGITVFGLDTARSSDWAIAHDALNLYIAVTVYDDTPNKDSDVFYNDDSIELFFDGGYQRNSRYDSDDTQVILRENGERTGIVDRNIDIDYKRRYDADEHRYIYEIRLLKSSLQLGTGEFGFELHINDDLDGDLRDNKFGWAAEPGADTQWYDMSVMGHACFEGGGATENCLLSTNRSCIDDDGDGWGWNGVASCRICIDTDPVGDGWGWNGTESCRIECIDTDPPGDGWGWDGSKSCRIRSATTCIDTDPVGDGWGWNGVESCRL